MTHNELYEIVKLNKDIRKLKEERQEFSYGIELKPATGMPGSKSVSDETLTKVMRITAIDDRLKYKQEQLKPLTDRLKKEMRNLTTKRQKTVIKLYYLKDYSESRIARYLKSSRQNVHGIRRKAEEIINAINRYETGK